MRKRERGGGGEKERWVKQPRANEIEMTEISQKIKPYRAQKSNNIPP